MLVAVNEPRDTSDDTILQCPTLAAWSRNFAIHIIVSKLATFMWATTSQTEERGRTRLEWSYFWDVVPYHYVQIRREYFFATGQDLPPKN